MKPFGEQIGILRTPVPGPRSLDLARRLSRVEAPGVTYLGEDFPVFWEEALGSNVRDVDGNVYVDLTAAFGVAALGHNPPTVSARVTAQLRRLAHGMGDVHPPAIKVELIERLARLFPAKGAMVYLAVSGADAVETALKTARLATGRTGVIAFDGSYHGLTYGTLAVSGQSRFREPFEAQVPTFGRLATYPRAGEGRDEVQIQESLQELEALVHENEAFNAIGALLVEPIQGRGGILIPPRGWLRAVRAFTEQHGILLILDEIFTGLGRTGTILACRDAGVVPDLLCLGKALSGMFPFSACIGKAKVLSAWPASGGESLQTSTFLGNPLGCAAALASLEEMDRLNVAERARESGFLAIKYLAPLAAKDIQVRGRGLMIGVEIPGPEAVAFEAAKRLLRRGVLVLPSGPRGDVLSLTPPLTISKDQLVWALGEVFTTLQEFHA